MTLAQEYRQLNIRPLTPSFRFFFSKTFIYLFIFRQRGTEGEREGEKHLCVVVSCAPLTGGSGPRPKPVPTVGIKPATL